LKAHELEAQFSFPVTGDGARTFLSAAMSVRRNALGESAAARKFESCCGQECPRSTAG